jgi:hypothetical protein
MTGIPDLDERVALEDRFYAEITAHETLTDSLRKITVIFE